MPNTEIIERWVTALESGEYAQTKGVLHRLNDVAPNPKNYEKGASAGFCCLGVLCDLAVKDGIIPEPTVYAGHGDNDPLHNYGGTYGGYQLPPETVAQWAGLPSTNPDVDYFGSDRSACGDHDCCAPRTRFQLSDLNDDQGLSFPEIAALIRAEFLTEKKEND